MAFLTPYDTDTCSGPYRKKGTIVVQVPGLQGPPGEAGVLYEKQELTEEQKSQARANIDAASVEELANAQGFSVRYASVTLEPSSTNFVSVLTPTTKVKEGDSVIDASGALYQVTKVTEPDQFTVTAKLAQLGVTDYNDLENKPTLGKLASLDEVSESELKDVINLGELK